MREIVLDTETTGLDPRDGHRIIEIGCIELVNHIPTGASYHEFIDPERAVPQDAVNVHGITTQMVTGKPKFAAIAPGFLAFIGDSRLVIHNAGFDVNFLNFELDRCGQPPLGFDRVVDTLALARRKHPGGPNSLDALCKRYGIDNTQRTKHGALVDSELLAAVYLELIGGHQTRLELVQQAGGAQARSNGRGTAARPRPGPLPERLTAEEIAAHRQFLATLGGAVWLDWLESEEKA
ncbi:MAG: DNA polymerase III subunit epsilon [Hyphomicrobiaceae bacterium]